MHMQMRAPEVVLQCWWRQRIARRLCAAERDLQDAEDLELWSTRDIRDAPAYVIDLFAGMPTVRAGER